MYAMTEKLTTQTASGKMGVEEACEAVGSRPSQYKVEYIKRLSDQAFGLAMRERLRKKLQAQQTSQAVSGSACRQ